MFVANGEVAPVEVAIDGRGEQGAAKVDARLDVASHDGDESFEGGHGEVEVEVGTRRCGAAVGTDAVAGEGELQVARGEGVAVVIEAAAAADGVVLPAAFEAFDGEGGVAVAAVGADVAVKLQVEGGVVFFAVDVADGEGAVPGGAAAEIGVAAVFHAATEGGEAEAGVFQGSAVDVGVEGEVGRWAVGVVVVGVEGGAEGIKGAVEVEAAVATVFFVSEVVPGEGAL